VALTFDDGPSLYTPQILAILERYRVPATFFLIGYNVVVFPQFVRDEVRAGEEIGNHTYNHVDLQSYSTPQVVAQLARNQAVIHRAAGVTPHWFRPPYMDVDSRIVGIAAALGLRTVTWSVDPRDWALPGVPYIVQTALNNIQPGSVVIMHDGGGNRSETVSALPTIIRDLKKSGYRFATLDELFGLAPMPPCVPGAPRFFARSGVRAQPSHAIYQTWASLLCKGTSIGPATSQEYSLGRGIVAQDFRTTAHRLELNVKNGHVRVLVVWSWAAAVFSARHVSPKFGQPLTHAWFNQYFQGHDWGPALHSAKRDGRFIVQQFLYGWALEWPDGIVQWMRHLHVPRS